MTNPELPVGLPPPDRNAELRAWVATMRADFPAARVAYFDGPGGVRGDATLAEVFEPAPAAGTWRTPKPRR